MKIFKGKIFKYPQSFVFTNDSALKNVGSEEGHILGVIAEGEGFLTPKTPTLVYSQSDVKNLVSPNTDLREAGLKALEPQGELNAPPKIYLIQLNDSTKGNYTFTAGAGTVKIESIGYGKWCNNIGVKIVSDTEIAFRYGTNEETITTQGGEIFSLQYIGGGTTATVSFDRITKILTTKVDSADDLTINFNDYNSIDEIINFINSNSDYTAISLTPKTQKMIILDNVTDVDIKANAYNFTNYLEEQLNVLNNNGYVQVNDDSTATDKISATSEFVYLSGGNSSTVQNSDWDSILEKIEKYNIDIIVPFSYSDYAISVFKTWVKEQENKSKYRYFFIGDKDYRDDFEANKTTYFSEIKSFAKTISSERFMYFPFGHKDYDEEGNMKKYSGMFTALKYANISAGQVITHPLTRDYINAYDIEYNCTPNEINDLIDYGIAILNYDDIFENGYWLIRQLTTYMLDDNLRKKEFSMLATSDYIAKRVKKEYEKRIGKEGTNYNYSQVISSTKVVLATEKENGIIYDYNKDSIKARVENDTVYISYSFQMITPINYIFGEQYIENVNVELAL